MPAETELDFEILREPWNKYSLQDGANVKSRYILTKVKRKEAEKEGAKASYGVEGQTLTVIYNVPENLKGPPTDQTYSPQEISASIVVDEVPYTTLSEEWNEYVIEDGTKLRVKGTIVKVSRTNKTDRNGDPVYLIQHGMLMGVKPAKV